MTRVLYGVLLTLLACSTSARSQTQPTARQQEVRILPAAAQPADVARAIATAPTGEIPKTTAGSEAASASKDDKSTNETKMDILVKVDRALNPESYVSYKKIINIDTKGVKKEFVMYIGKLGADKVLGAFLSPKSEIGRATLRIGDNMWLYIPNVKKPVRITSLQSVIGGLFNNADIMSIDYASEYDCIDLQEKDGAWMLELKAKTRSVAYEKVMIKADKTTFIPAFIECFTAGGMLVKTLHFKNITEFESGFSRPAVVETDSPLFKGAKSIMIYSQLKRVKLDEELFNVNNMATYKELR